GDRPPLPPVRRAPEESRPPRSRRWSLAVRPPRDRGARAARRLRAARRPRPLGGDTMVAPAAPTILYVDDDDDSRRTLAWIFRHEGFRVEDAATGGEARGLVREKPDLVILAVNLPDINGFDVCRQIKAHPATTRIPVLHMSAVYVQAEDRTQALDGGADGYLLKPVDPRELLAQAK